MSFTGDTHLFKKRPQTTDRDPQEAIPLNLPKTMRFDNGSHIHKHPAGPETVPIKRTFLKNMVILPQCRADLMIGNPGKTWRVFRFSASSLQRMRSKQLAVSILVNASPLPSSSIHHQEVTFGTQVAGN